VLYFCHPERTLVREGSAFSTGFVLGHDFKACPERSRRVPISPLFLSFLVRCSARGICFYAFFSSLLRAKSGAAMVTYLEMNGFTWNFGEVEETAMVQRASAKE
jgi:hypothetical protein